MELNTAIATPTDSGKGSTPIAGTARHVLPPLPYAYGALEPHIDARTMTLHRDKHHAAYVEELKAALEPYAELRRRSARWLLQNSEAIPGSILDVKQGSADDLADLLQVMPSSQEPAPPTPSLRSISPK